MVVPKSRTMNQLSQDEIADLDLTQIRKRMSKDKNSQLEKTS